MVMVVVTIMVVLATVKTLASIGVGVCNYSSCIAGSFDLSIKVKTSNVHKLHILIVTLVTFLLIAIESAVPCASAGCEQGACR